MTSELPSSVETLVDMVRWRAESQPDRQAFTFLVDGENEEEHLSYGGLDRKCRAVAARLQQVTEPGDRVLLLFPTGFEFYCGFLGCQYAGVIAVPVCAPNPSRRAGGDPFIHVIAANAGARVALSTDAIRSAAEPILAVHPDTAPRHWITTSSIDDDLAARWTPPAIGRDDLVLLQYTSGSTSDPRGVMVSHANMLHNMGCINRCFGHSSEDRGVIWLPPYHDMGLTTGMLQPLYSGGYITLMSPISVLLRPFRWLQAISRHRAHTSGSPNFAYDLCMRRITEEQLATLDLSCWKVAFNGAEPVRRETIERFTRMFEPCGFRPEAFLPAFGLAEATLMVTGLDHRERPSFLELDGNELDRHRVVLSDGPSRRDVVGCGTVIDDTEVIIVDPQTHMRCEPDGVGEIWVAGPGVTRGYWNQPEATAATFGAMLADGGGPYMRTGDLGFLHEGELFVTGRIKDVIIQGGRNHYPQDLERTAEDFLVSRRAPCCAAFAIDVDGSERVVIVAETDAGGRAGADQRHEDGPADEASDVSMSIRRAVSEQHEVAVHDVVLVRPGRIPKTTSGKIRRRACRDAYLSDSFEMREIAS